MTQKIRFYNYADQNDLRLSLDIDNAEKLPEMNSVSNGVSFEEKPNSSFKIIFRLGVNSEIFDHVSPKNSFEDENDFNYFISYISPTSRKRKIIELTKSDAISINTFIYFEKDILINPNEWFGHISFTGFVVRKKSRRETKGFLTDKYSIVGNTEEFIIYIDPIEKFDGSEIEMDDGQIPQKDALYQLIQSNPPKIMINEDAPEFTLKMLRHKGSGDRRALIRDTLFAPILVDVWEQLARAGIYKMLPESDHGGEVISPQYLSKPYNSIVNDAAKKMYPDADDAAQALVDELEEDPQTVINEKLHQAVQVIGDLNKHYEKCAKEYWRGS